MRKRIPFTGTYNTRSSAVNGLPSSSGVVGVGVVGTMIVGLATLSSDKDVRYINCVPISVPDEAAQTKRIYVMKRPGFVESLEPAPGEKGYAVHVWVGHGSGENVISAFGATNSTIYNAEVSLGAITGRGTGITETILSGTATLAITSSDSTAWYYQPSGSLTKISDADFPGNAGRTLAGTFAHLDGYAFVMDTGGRIYNSDLNSITAWSATSYLTANAYPDQGVGLIRHKNTILAFGKESFEVYRNAGNAAGSPLARIEELSQLIGCVSAEAIGTIQDVVFWVGATKQGVMGVWKYNGAQSLKVSTAEIDAQIALAGPANVTVTTLGYHGRNFVVVLASNTTYVYCIEENNWHEWNSTVPLWFKADGVSVGSTMVNYVISNLSTSGKVYVFNPAAVSYQDDGEAFSAIIQTSKLDFGTNLKKTFNRIDVIADQESTTSELEITWSDDDYVTDSTARTVDLSEARPNLTRCGRARRRSFTFTHSANTPMRLEAIDVDFTVDKT